MTRYRSVLIAAGRPVAQPLWIARSAPERMRGLLGRRGLPAGEALLIEGWPLIKNGSNILAGRKQGTPGLSYYLPDGSPSPGNSTPARRTASAF